MPSVDQQTLLAVVRAARPKFRNQFDRLAFAVHAYMLADEYKLVAVAADAEDSKDAGSESEEVGLEGWTSLTDCYAFRYVDTTGAGEGKRSPVIVKALVVAEQLMVNWLAPATSHPPASLVLDPQHYTTDQADLSKGYRDLDDLCKRLHASFHGTEPSESSQSGKVRGNVPAREAEDRRPEPVQHSDEDPLYIPPRPRIGGDDIVPAGFRPPGMGSGGGFPGMPGMGGGMHMGPDDPIFAGRMRGQPSRGGLPPGARWDPINPPGLEGFNPGDFQRPGQHRALHPDLAQPGPGSTDWESLYG